MRRRRRVSSSSHPTDTLSCLPVISLSLSLFPASLLPCLSAATGEFDPRPRPHERGDQALRHLSDPRDDDAALLAPEPWLTRLPPSPPSSRPTLTLALPFKAVAPPLSGLVSSSPPPLVSASSIRTRSAVPPLPLSPYIGSRAPAAPVRADDTLPRPSSTRHALTRSPSQVRRIAPSLLRPPFPPTRGVPALYLPCRSPCSIVRHLSPSRRLVQRGPFFALPRRRRRPQRHRFPPRFGSSPAPPRQPCPPAASPATARTSSATG